MINTVALTGRLTYPPEMKVTASGVAFTNFQIAVDRPYGKDKTADFIDCVAWRQTAEFISKYFNKGDPIGLEGSIRTENYTDKNGNKRKDTRVNVDRASFISSKAKSENNGVQGGYEEILEDDDDVELPF